MLRPEQRVGDCVRIVGVKLFLRIGRFIRAPLIRTRFFQSGNVSDVGMKRCLNAQSRQARLNTNRAPSYKYAG